MNTADSPCYYLRALTPMWLATTFSVSACGCGSLGSVRFFQLKEVQREPFIFFQIGFMDDGFLFKVGSYYLNCTVAIYNDILRGLEGPMMWFDYPKSTYLIFSCPLGGS